MGERLIEGFWDCPYCGRKRISGLERECSCGAERGEDVKFYMDGVHYIDDETAKTISKNPDWLCSYCGALVSDNKDICHNCGASRADSEMNYFQNRAKKEINKKKETGTYDNSISKEVMDEIEKIEDSVRDIYESNTQNIYNTNTSEKISSKKKFSFNHNIFKFGIIGLLTISLIIGLVFLLSPKSVEGTVESFSWSRSISVEELKTLQESDWILPSGGRLQYSQREIRRYEQVVDHYETKTRTYTEQVFDHYEEYVSGYRDNGNGTFSEITSQRPVYRTETRTETYQEPVYRQEPVYDTKYYYEIDRWMHREYIKTSGDDKEPYWGEYLYKEKEREGNKSETYKITIKDSDGKIHQYTVEYDLWNRLILYQKVELKVDVFGNAELKNENE